VSFNFDDFSFDKKFEQDIFLLARNKIDLEQPPQSGRIKANLKLFGHSISQFSPKCLVKTFFLETHH